MAKSPDNEISEPEDPESLHTSPGLSTAEVDRNEHEKPMVKTGSMPPEFLTPVGLEEIDQGGFAAPFTRPDISRHDRAVSAATAELSETAEQFNEGLAPGSAPLGLEQMRNALQQAQFALQVAEQKLYALQIQHEKLVRSRSWRLTKPLRALDRLRRGNLSDFADGLWRQVTLSAGELPSHPENARERIALSLVRLLHPVLKHSDAYQRWHSFSRDAEVPALAAEMLDQDRLAEEAYKLRLLRSDQPLVSIVIASYGNLPLTLAALKSVELYPPSVPYEVIVVEDASGDLSMEVLRAVPSLLYFENPINLGFLQSSNRAATAARGQFILMMNNDAELTSGAVDALLNIFKLFPDAGIAGAKLIYPNGRLQEAGGVVWSDGSAWNYGRMDHAAAPRYNFVREVDYCSGAALLISAALFKDLGGFDEYYTPAYYEDTDLAFRARELGRKVYYQPKAVVIHREGMSHGSDPKVGVKSYQRTNQQKFLNRWGSVLQRDHAPPSNHLFHAGVRDRDRKIILVIDRFVPRTDQDAGSRSMLHLMMGLLRIGYSVKFWPHDPAGGLNYIDDLQQRGIEVLHDRDRFPSFDDWYRQTHSNVDVVLLSRPNVAVNYISTVRRHGKALLVFYGHDIHYRRLAAELDYDPANQLTRRSHEFFSKLEPSLWQQTDIIYYPSVDETEIVRDALHRKGSKATARTIPVYAYENFPSVDVDLDRRSDLLFVGSFSHQPNVDGVLWFCREILPVLTRLWPSLKVQLIGSDPPEQVRKLACHNIEVTGFISDAELEQRYLQARVAIAPLRFGGGMKGKVIEALRFGLPIVTTSAGVQGFQDWEGIIARADDAESFADAIVRLLKDPLLWNSTSTAAQDYARQNFSLDSLEQVLVLDLSPAKLGIWRANSQQPSQEVPQF
jgi:GT2 family glycosyltransferase